MGLAFQLVAMSKARTFTRTEIMDAARAAAETGLTVRLYPDKVMEFSQPALRKAKEEPTPEELLERWIQEQDQKR
ncbi:hypothetical protein RHIZ404_230653 [Rhizobium sp. EC-SD404]|nr:hypothetical protein RHIZ404_230653 [Rhizobium sp. EC-SD404]